MQKWHSLLLRAVTPIPNVQADDSVRWHCDMIHGVDPVKNQQGWGNVMYLPAAPWCPRHEAYAASVRDAFLCGSSPTDFPAEHYERTWDDRFTPEQLNDWGARPRPRLTSARTRTAPGRRTRRCGGRCASPEAGTFTPPLCLHASM
jgi:hypothetical protein